MIDLPFCLLSASLLLIPALVKGRFFRTQGILSLVLYILYTVLLFVLS